jgi:acid phosphatase type 7
LKLAAAGPLCVAAPVQAAPAGCLRSPYLQDVSATGATILWTLGFRGNATLWLKSESGEERVSGVAHVREFPAHETGWRSTYFLYRVSLADLRPDTSYTYEIRVEGQAVGHGLTAPAGFRTAAPGSAFRFLHFADSGTGSEAQRRLAARMLAEDTHLVLANGDLAYDLATHADVEEKYFEIYREMMARTPFFAALGNHEYYTEASRPFLANGVTPTRGVPPADWGRYYSFEWGSAHFVALDSNEPLTRADRGDNAMLAWLERDLAATRKFWRIVFFHHPPHATGKHERQPEAERVRRHILPILERYGVQLVLNGHEHNYQRTLPMLAGLVSQSEGIVYITSGGGGQHTYESPLGDWMAMVRGVNHYLRGEVTGAALTVSAIAIDGEAIDSVRLAPRPKLAGPAQDAASASPRLACGGLATIFGWNLCSEQAHPVPSATEVSGTSVTLAGHRLPILYADANQINFHLPWTFTGADTLTVVTPNSAAGLTVNVAAVAPALFRGPDGHAIALDSSGAAITAVSPVRGGDTITLFATGLGGVEGFPEPGTTPAAPLRVTADVEVLVGGIRAEVESATLGAAYPGVYEVRVRMPGFTPPSAWVQLVAAGVRSDPAPLAMASRDPEPVFEPFVHPGAPGRESHRLMPEPLR